MPIRYVRFAAAITQTGLPDCRKRIDMPAVSNVAVHGTSSGSRRPPST